MDKNHLPKREEFTRTLQFQLRFRDLDLAGHVNNAVYATFFESARVDMLVRDNQWIEDGSTQFLLKAIEIVYHRPIVFPRSKSIDICTAVTKIGTSSVQLKHAIFDGDICAATSTSTMVLAKDGKPHPVPDVLKHALLG